MLLPFHKSKRKFGDKSIRISRYPQPTARDPHEDSGYLHETGLENDEFCDQSIEDSD